MTLADDTDRLFSARLDAAQRDEPEALRELVEEFTPDLVSYARRRGLKDPEGIAFGALFAAVENLEGFRGRDRPTFRAYLFTIVRRRSVDEIRTAIRRPRIADDVTPDMMIGLVDERASSFDERVADEAYVDDLLAELTAEQRQVLEMRLFSDLSIQETADRTGRSVTAVKAMQRRALVSRTATGPGGCGWATPEPTLRASTASGSSPAVSCSPSSLRRDGCSATAGSTISPVSASTPARLSRT